MKSCWLVRKGLLMTKNSVWLVLVLGAVAWGQSGDVLASPQNGANICMDGHCAVTSKNEPAKPLATMTICYDEVADGIVVVPCPVPEPEDVPAIQVTKGDKSICGSLKDIYARCMKGTSQYDCPKDSNHYILQEATDKTHWCHRVKP